MKPKFYLFLSLAFCALTMSAQEVIPGGSATAALNRDDNKEIMNQFLKGIKKNADIADDIDGTPYLFDDFTKAQLLFPDNDPLIAEVRYDIAKEEMHVRMDKDSYRVLHPGVSVVLNDVPYKMLSYRGTSNRAVDLLGYFAILTPDHEDKPLVLLLKHGKKIKRARPAAAMQQARPPKYVDQEDYYLMFQGSRPVPVDRNKNRFLEEFPEEHRASIARHMKENRLHPRSEADLEAIVQFYNASF